jgi:hypothetical protein
MERSRCLLEARDAANGADKPKVRWTVARLAARAPYEGAADGRPELVGQLTRGAPLKLTGKYFGNGNRVCLGDQVSLVQVNG